MAYQRNHGRAADALRPLSITRGYTKHAEGSVLICFGDTKVLCTATVGQPTRLHAMQRINQPVELLPELSKSVRFARPFVSSALTRDI